MIKEQIKAIIKQYADKGERLLEEAYENGEHASTTGYWDGYGDCANLLLRELDDMQEEPTIPDIVDEHFCEMLGEDSVSEESVFEELKSIHLKMSEFTRNGYGKKWKQAWKLVNAAIESIENYEVMNV